MPPKKKARGVSGAVATAAASSAHSAAGDSTHSAAAAGISASDSADADAAASSKRKQQPPPKRKAAQQEAGSDAADVGSADASQHAAAATAVDSAAAVTAAPVDEAMPQAAADADEDFVADAMGDADEEKSSGAAAASSAAPKKITRKAQLAEAKRLKKAAEAAAAAEAIAAAQAEMLKPKPPAVDASRCLPPHGLHGDVLHSLFEFMRMRELAAVIQLSRAWYGGVRGVPWASLHAEHQERFSVAEVCASPLAKQIGSLCIRSQVNRLGITVFELKLIHAFMPNLHALETKLLMKVNDAGPWLFPPNLQKLVLAPKHGGELSAQTVHSLLTSVAGLNRLNHLRIELSDTKEVVDFSPLLPIAAQLEEFHHYAKGHFRYKYFRASPYHEQQALEDQWPQADFLRHLVRVRRLTPGLSSRAAVCHMLRDPIPFAAVEEVEFNSPTSSWPGSFEPQLTERVQHLSSLTSLRFECDGSVDFLSRLTALRHLSIRLSNSLPSMYRSLASSLAQALVSCSQLSSLHLDYLAISSPQMEALCRVLPSLTQLDVCCESIGSLEFVAAAPHLIRLRVNGSVRQYPEELQHLSLLPRLEQLDLWIMPLGEQDLRDLTPPSRICPSLKAVRCGTPNMEQFVMRGQAVKWQDCRDWGS